MKLVVISPEVDEPREAEVLGELFAAGLERYHVRKPSWSREKMETWLRGLSLECRAKIVVHSHHELVNELGLGGRHWRDDERVGRGVLAEPRLTGDGSPYQVTSRSCHDLPQLRLALGHCDSVFFGPVFPSISKPGYAPRQDFPRVALSAVLATRDIAERRTTVLALGGINADTAPRALALGFDGVAVLGAIWQAADPVQAFVELQSIVIGAPLAGARASTSDAPTTAEVRRA